VWLIVPFVIWIDASLFRADAIAVLHRRHNCFEFRECGGIGTFMAVLNLNSSAVHTLVEQAKVKAEQRAANRAQRRRERATQLGLPTAYVAFHGW